VVKFKASEFRFRKEPTDYAPKPDFVPLIWVKRDDPDDGGHGAADGGDDAMDTPDSRSRPFGTESSQLQQAGPSTAAPGTSNTVASLIAVTPFNPNSQTPNAIEVVKKLHEISPSLEGRSSSLASHRVSVEALRMALDAVAVEHSRSNRPARGRVSTIGRISPMASK
jgi:hypothetical protein